MATNPATPASPLHFDIEESSRETIVRCSGKIVAETCAAFQEEVRRILAQGKPIVIDLSNVSSIDSAGLGALVALWSSAKRRAVEVDIRWAEPPTGPAPNLKIVNANDRVSKLLRLTRLDRLFSSSDERD